MPTSKPTTFTFDNLYELELNNLIQGIIRSASQEALVDGYSQKDLLSLIFKPHDVPALRANQAAREAAQKLYLSLQTMALGKVQKDYNSEKDYTKFKPVEDLLAALSPGYSAACRAYWKHREYCLERFKQWSIQDARASYYNFEANDKNFLFVETMGSAIDAARIGENFSSKLSKEAQAVAVQPRMNEGKNKNKAAAIALVAGGILLSGVALGLLIYATNELIKAYQEDKDSHSCQRKLTIIVPTLLTTAAAGYCAAAFVTVLTGLTLSTGGIALAVAAAVAITAVLSVLLFKALTNLAATHRYKLSNGEREQLQNCRNTHPDATQSRINEKKQEIDRLDPLGLTFFCSKDNNALRKERQDIYHLRTGTKARTIQTV